MINPENMCRKHLLGEHVELHMLLGCLKKDKSIDGYIKRKLIEPKLIYKRHEDIIKEMKKRGYKHDTDMKKEELDRLTEKYEFVNINIIKSYNDLIERCKDCREVMKKKEIIEALKRMGEF